MNNPEDLIGRMDRVIEWVKTCDEKASIILSITTIVPSIIFSSNFILEGMKNIRSNINCQKPFSIPASIAVISFIVSIVFVGLSLWYSIKVIRAKTKEDQTDKKNGNNQENMKQVKKNTLIHFHHISTLSYKEFSEKIDNEDDNDLLEDLKSQLYINACRCDEKFNDLNRGLLFLKISLVSMVILIVSLLFY